MAVFILILIIFNLSVFGSINVNFAGFEEGKIYIYILNGINTHVNLTCRANASNESISFQTAWYERGSSSVLEREILQFSQIAEYTRKDKLRSYYCMATTDFLSIQSKDITVHVEDNSTITINYNDTTEARTNNINHTQPILIPVLAMDVVLTCNAEGAGWRYTDKGTRQLEEVRGDQLKISVLSLGWMGRIDCTRKAGTYPAFVATGIVLIPVGSGIGFQGKDGSFITIEDDVRLEITQDTTVICATSDITATNWFYRGYSINGSDEIIGGNDSISVNKSELDTRGIVKLDISYPLHTVSSGYYSCNTFEKISDTDSRMTNHMIQIVAGPIDMSNDTATTESTTQTVVGNPTQSNVLPTTVSSTTIMLHTSNSTPTIQSAATTDLNETNQTDTRTITSSPIINANFITTNTTMQPTISSSTAPNITIPSISSNTTILTPTQNTTIPSHSSNATQITIPTANTQTTISSTTDTQTTISSTTDTHTNTSLTTNTQTNTSSTTDTHTNTSLTTNTHTNTSLTTNTHTNTSSNTNTHINTSSNTNTHINTSSNTNTHINTSSNTNTHTNTSLTTNTHTNTSLTTNTHTNTSLTTNIHINTSSTSARLQLLAPYIGALIGLLIILVSLCIIVMCLCCILKRKSKLSLGREELALAPQNDRLGYNIPPTRYTQLKESHTPAAVQSPSNQIETETQLTSPIKKMTNGSYSKLEDSESLDILIVKNVSRYPKDRIESPMSGSVLSQTSVTRYQDDPNAVLIELQHYKQHLDTLLSENRMEKEYNALGGLELRYDCEHAFLEQNYNKNKYKMIYPYDKSRVVITDISSCGNDYINASYIPGFYTTEHFIAAQAPKPNTLSSFWHMVWEQGVRTIVSLTNRVEQGRTKYILYWPGKIGDSVDYGAVNVSLLKEEEFGDYTVRELLVSGVSNRKIRTKQFHYTAWSDHSVPQLYNNLLAFIQVVKDRERKINSSPILVHCTAGVGRSGIFIAQYNLQDAINQGVPISVFRLVNEMREHRPHMIQTFLQYKYIYLAILEMIMGCTSILNDEFRDTFSLYLQAEEPGYLSVFKLQFEELNYQTEKCFNHQCSVAYYPENANKNTADTTVPFDTTRVILSSPSWNCDYVNASYINGNRLIATALPREDTLQEFLQLVYQLDNPIVVVLLSRQEYEAVRRGSGDFVCYWSEEKGSKEFGAFKVEMESMIKSPFYIQHKMNVCSGYENQQRSFCQYISFYWSESDKSTDDAAAITLLDHITINLAENTDKNAVFCCSDSIGKSGIMLAVLLSIQNMKESGSVDLFQTVKRLRYSRDNMVPTKDHYISCYSLLDEYFRLNMT